MFKQKESLDKIDQYLTSNGIELFEATNTNVGYKSNGIVIYMTHSVREELFVLWIGKNQSNLIEIDNETLKGYFRSDLLTSKVPEDIFLQNCLIFFQTYLKNIVAGGDFSLDGLCRFKRKRSEDYTTEIQVKHLLIAAENAWKINDYEGVVKNLEKLKEKEIPHSIQKKYEIALRKLAK